MILKGGSTILGLADYIPEQRVSTEETMSRFSHRYGISDDYLKRTTGIFEKRRSLAGQMPSDLAVNASRTALAKARLHPKDIHAIIYCGLIRDFEEPATSHIVQDKLGAKNAMCFDVTNACHGFANGIFVADTLVSAHQNIKSVLVITGEQGSRFEDQAVDLLLNEQPEKRLLRTLTAGLTLGDAGGAIIIGRKKGDTGFTGYNVASFGQFHSLCVAGSPLEQGALKTRMASLMSEAAPRVASMYREFLTKRALLCSGVTAAS
ncbi:MAG: hypothetical protein GKR96_11445 [Gammaproteobacteria bacterium]|nr:hypothetical protein [Gammaproteobacteria bacterium]